MRLTAISTLQEKNKFASSNMFKVSISILLLFIIASENSLAATKSEEEQDNIYVRCIAENNVDPKQGIPPDIYAKCNKKAGFVDLGEEERESRHKSWRNCLLDKSVEFDDLVSPASDIAKAIIPLCHKYWESYVQSLWTPHTVKRKMIHDSQEHALSDGVRAVLLHRRVVRERQQK